ncbi:tyrosine-protein phosphatase [Flavobacterium channae]|uniref:tyrosine-protein phosphatase n=1 Tax=Flavobacterium channae TaxID=2897181 RepID=UPI001E4BA207|nr:CpsB/CapC family capsule biosynthesis tyrosine phosphatase [Flavobacterium channae]UGS24190.1 histidinol phosphatase [Flavobacterium channae]
MLSLFKSKPKLAELIPSGYVDIHSHVLPGIDDGAQNIADTEFLLKEMKQLGFSKVITTPHTMKNVWDNTTDSIRNTHVLVQKELPELSKKVALNCASEYFLDENLMQLAQQESLLTLKDNVILIEMSYLNAPIQLYDFLFELQLKGYQLVLAHPERYNYFHSNKKEFAKLKKAGCLFQLNLLATVGYYGKNVAETADYLLKEDLYDFVGSDIHHKNHVAAFQNKVIIKNHKTLEETMTKNVFFK